MTDTATGLPWPLFMASALLLNATPGVDLLLTVSRTARAGARAGLATAVGIGCGCALHALAAAFGLAALLALSALAFDLLKWAGAAYLLWLGIGPLRQAWRLPVHAAPCAAKANPALPPCMLGTEFRRGLLTNLLNPKVALFMLAFVPQFIPVQSTHKTLMFLALGAVFVVQGTLFLLAVVAVTARVARLPLPRAAARVLHGAAGALFVGLALRLAGARNEGA